MAPPARQIIVLRMGIPEPCEPPQECDFWMRHPRGLLSPPEIRSFEKNEQEAMAEIRELLFCVHYSPGRAFYATDHEPEINWALTQEMNMFIAKDEPTSAVLLALYAIRKGLGNGSIIHLAADALADAGEFNDARAMLMKGVDLLRYSAYFFYDLARYEVRMGDLDMAEARLRRALVLDEKLMEAAVDEQDFQALWGPLCAKWVGSGESATSPPRGT